MTLDASRLVGLVQPDPTSCGPSCLVGARMLLDPAYSARVATPAGWSREVLATHRSVTRLLAPTGPQVPWPRRFGTPPWSEASALSATTGARYRVHVVRWFGARAALARAKVALAAGRPVALYVGDRWIPRHVLLATAVSPDGSTMTVYNPGPGTVAALAALAVDLRAALARIGRWTSLWYVLNP